MKRRVKTRMREKRNKKKKKRKNEITMRSMGTGSKELTHPEWVPNNHSQHLYRNHRDIQPNYPCRRRLDSDK